MGSPRRNPNVCALFPSASAELEFSDEFSHFPSASQAVRLRSQRHLGTKVHTHTDAAATSFPTVEIIYSNTLLRSLMDPRLGHFSPANKN
jgi:hypothetical protein